jgi:ribonuclease VapC
VKIKYVVDASALLAVVLNEPYPEDLLDVFSESIITTINLTEVLTVLARKYPSSDPEQIWSMVSNFIQHHYDVDSILAKKVLEISNVANDSGLSLGDKFCLALGSYLHLPIYTGDHVWKQLETELNVKINLIR